MDGSAFPPKTHDGGNQDRTHGLVLGHRMASSNDTHKQAAQLVYLQNHIVLSLPIATAAC